MRCSCLRPTRRRFPPPTPRIFSGDAAALDVTFLEAAEKDPARLHLDIYRPDPRRKDKFFLKIFRGQDAIPISDLLPMLENMGLKVIAERPYELEFAGGRPRLDPGSRARHAGAPVAKFEVLESEIKSAFTAVWTGRMDSDSFNQLTLTAGVPWRLVTVLRAYCRYLLQTGLPFSQGYIAQVLVNQREHCARARATSSSRASTPRAPTPTRRSALARLDEQIRAELEEVTRSDEDRILRALWNALSATRAHQRLSDRAERGSSRIICPSRSKAKSCANCRCRSRCSRSSYSRRAWKACTCAWGTWRAAASAGRIGARTSAPRYSG